jgi:hypothetical protein
MKITIYACLIMFWGIIRGWSQETDTIAHSKFEHYATAFLYIKDKEYFFSPVYAANKDKLHLEFRYNYEEAHTLSGWVGYNFSGGKKFKYFITPILGGLVGNLKGMAPGFELDFEYGKFELNSETEYVFVFNADDHSSNFSYTWIDFTYYMKDWLYFGLSAQRTRLFKSELEIQRGFKLGTTYKWLDITGYYYNPGTSDNYFILSFTANFLSQNKHISF